MHVIAAGSLLEFALEELPSFGVGRISSIFLYPFSFSEFLIASGKKLWVDEIEKANPQNPVFEALHVQIVNQMQIFCLTGGMPAAVSKYVETRDLLSCQEVLNDLLQSFRTDFAKYKTRVSAARINEVFESVSQQAEGKFVYERAGVQLSNRQVKAPYQTKTFVDI